MSYPIAPAVSVSTSWLRRSTRASKRPIRSPCSAISLAWGRARQWQRVQAQDGTVALQRHRQ